MISFNENVNLLHEAYCSARGYTVEELALDQCSERQWLNAHNFGITPDDVKLVVKLRMRLNSEGAKWGLLIRNLAGDEESLSVFRNQLAEIRASLRKPKHCPGKVTVLEATHRTGEIEQPDAKLVGAIMIEAMRKATA